MNNSDLGKETCIVLLVEDEKSHAEFIIRVFDEDALSWQINYVATLSDALKWLKQNKSIDYIVISDYQLPDGTGLKLTNGASSPEQVGYPLIILTGVGSEELAVRSLKSGAMDYVVKNPDDLKELPQTALRAIREWKRIGRESGKRTNTILLVEDNEAHAKFITRVFNEDALPWQINHVATLSDALEWLEENKKGNCLVISDYRLPDGTGLQLTKGACSPKEVGFPLIILTGVGSEELAVRSLKSGAMDYVVKNPKDMMEIPKTARRVLGEWDRIIKSSNVEGSFVDKISKGMRIGKSRSAGTDQIR
jgi:DNA-binding NtrC family response regulator